MITAQIYQAGVLRKSWKFRFIGANNQKFGHNYNSPEFAADAIRTLLTWNIPVRLEVLHPDGRLEDKGQIR
jgi:hypothetical protein